MKKSLKSIYSTLVKAIIPGILDGLILIAGIAIHPAFLILGAIFFIIHWRYLGHET